jgi:molybdenum cofactor cytidylyltransferase
MIAAVVLAAGMSTRMGRPKLLLPYGEHTVIEHIIVTLLALPLGEVVVVTGHEQSRLEMLLGRWPVRTVHNPDYREGEMLSSLQIGLRSVAPVTQAALLVLGDMPALDSDVVRQLIQAYQASDWSAVVIPSYRMRAGHPVLIPRHYWQEILELPQEANPRSVLRGPNTSVIWVKVNSPSVVLDIDTPQDYEQGLHQKDHKLD